jgi:hypothetical protein
VSLAHDGTLASATDTALHVSKEETLWSVDAAVSCLAWHPSKRILAYGVDLGGRYGHVLRMVHF